MRAFKTLLAGALLLTFASFANAQTVIRITGSTAFRGQTVTAIRNLYTANLVYGYGGGTSPNSFTSARAHIFKGDIGSNTNVTIKCSWSGAVDGQLAVVSGDLAVKYLEDGGHTLSPALSPTGTPNVGDNTSFNADAPSDVAMLDHFQSTTPFKAPAFPNMTIEPVGVIAFKWVVNPGQGQTSMSVTTTTGVGADVLSVADTSSLSVGMTLNGNANIAAAGTSARISQIIDGTTFRIVNNLTGAPLNAAAAGTASTNFVACAPISNMTPLLAQALYTSGFVSLATATGNAADNTQVLWAMGRDAGSGTRLQAHQEAGIGYNSQVIQFQPIAAGGVFTDNVLAVNSSSVLEAIKLLHPNAGDGGYSSGGTISTTIRNRTANPLDKDGLPHGAPTGPTAMGYFVSYMGISDADNAINAGAKELTWNGVKYSEVGVQQGSYTFWGYEAIGYLPSLGGTKRTVVDMLEERIRDFDAPSPLYGTMKCVRTADGGAVLQNY